MGNIYVSRVGLISRAAKRACRSRGNGLIRARVTRKLVARGSWQDGGKGSVGIEVRHRVTPIAFLSINCGKGVVSRDCAIEREKTVARELRDVANAVMNFEK